MSATRLDAGRHPKAPDPEAVEVGGRSLCTQPVRVLIRCWSMSQVAQSENQIIIEDMSKGVSATDAARGFSDLLNRVHYRGESFDVMRGGQVVARIAPPMARRCTASVDTSFADDLEQIQREQPVLPGDPWAT